MWKFLKKVIMLVAVLFFFFLVCKDEEFKKTAIVTGSGATKLTFRYVGKAATYLEQGSDALQAYGTNPVAQKSSVVVPNLPAPSVAPNSDPVKAQTEYQKAFEDQLSAQAEVGRLEDSYAQAKANENEQMANQIKADIQSARDRFNRTVEKAQRLYNAYQALRGQ